ncbi:AraC family transcriptional regulator [Frateuria sp. Soil773]|uniref:AraC family transcriptional regulator n=1 Tax=Frateuria sp. Soil773 TaxID=1736407 RepID=UPI0006F93480|nr:helix-turn-helix domain-containing protein [Frateuria sp. Soil773]KRF02103.1 AraC family transcriptional regulator [Frateuria sp. Soil773]
MDIRDDGRLLPCDLVSLSGMLRVCKMETVLLNADGPRAVIDSLVQGEALFCSAESAFPFRGRFTLPIDWCLFGFVHHTEESSWCHGISFSSGTAFTVLPEGTTEFRLSAGSRLSFVLLPLETLQRRYAELDRHHAGEPIHLPSLVRLSYTPAAQRLQAIYHDVRQRLIHGPPEGGGEAGIDIEALLDSHLTASLAATGADLPNCTRGRRKHYLILQRTEQYMRANLRNDIYVNEMCNAAGVSERALRYAFEDLLGISPNRYLSMLRLCTACRSLALSDVSRRSVKSVALSCGLWDLSRFADSYRRVFGELPHDTLMRSPPGDALSAP